MLSRDCGNQSVVFHCCLVQMDMQHFILKGDCLLAKSSSDLQVETWAGSENKEKLVGWWRLPTRCNCLFFRYYSKFFCFNKLILVAVSKHREMCFYFNYVLPVWNLSFGTRELQSPCKGEPEVIMGLDSLSFLGNRTEHNLCDCFHSITMHFFVGSLITCS